MANITLSLFFMVKITYFRLVQNRFQRMKNLALFIVVIMMIACKNDADQKNFPTPGLYRASLLLDHSKEIPFLVEWTDKNNMTILNADEKISVTEITYRGDSIFIQMPVYEGVLKGIFAKDSIYGEFIKPSLNRNVPFKMVPLARAERFPITSAPTQTIKGNWETIFSPDSDEDRYIAKGIFDQLGNKVTGTFRTTTGDYRYLEGILKKDSLKLSTFDGAHAFLFEAEVKDSVMTGIYYSGNHWQEPFTARRNENYELPKADSLTFLKEGYDKVEFSFPNSDGKLVTLSDEKYINKVVIVQIMGTWCPNCLDETKYLTEYYKNKKPKDVEMIALAFEYAPTEEKAIAAINRLKNAIGVPYPILLAQFGTSDKTEANNKLPMLDHIISYPTTIFIDKMGKVRKIHTGFNGPATGEEFTKFKQDFEGFVKTLSEE